MAEDKFVSPGHAVPAEHWGKVVADAEKFAAEAAQENQQKEVE